MARTAAPVTPDATATMRSMAAFPGDHLGDEHVTNLAGNLCICKIPEKLRRVYGKYADGHHFNADGFSHTSIHDSTRWKVMLQ